VKTIIYLRGGPLCGEPHACTGRIPDIIERTWEHSTSRHIYELCVDARKKFFYGHVKSYRPATQDCQGL